MQWIPTYVSIDSNAVSDILAKLARYLNVEYIPHATHYDINSVVKSIFRDGVIKLKYQICKLNVIRKIAKTVTRLRGVMNIL